MPLTEGRELLSKSQADSSNIIPVLDHGYIRLCDHMGTDLTVVNAAKVSFNKKADSFDANGSRLLLKTLGPKGHLGPFKHPQIQFEIKMPLFVARQLMTHRVGICWSERSLRYTESDLEFYNPKMLFDFTVVADEYKYLIEQGINREEARLILPLATYTTTLVTMSLLAASHLIKLRDDKHAQFETQEYARAIKTFVGKLFPVSLEALLGASPNDLSNTV